MGGPYWWEAWGPGPQQLRRTDINNQRCSDCDRDRRRKMAATRPEAVVSRVLYKIASKFQSLYTGIQGRQSRRNHVRYVSIWPHLRTARAADRASTIWPTYRRFSLEVSFRQHAVRVRISVNPAAISQIYACEEDIHCVLRLPGGHGGGGGSTRPTARCSDCRWQTRACRATPSYPTRPSRVRWATGGLLGPDHMCSTTCCF
jgi:hypothetical protein